MFPFSSHSWSTSIPCVTAAAIAILASACSPAPRKPLATISAPDRMVLSEYENVRAALAADDLRRTRLAGEKLLKAIDAPGVTTSVAKTRNAAKLLAEGFRIDLARAAFKEISGALIPVCEGTEGFFVISTSLVPEGNWIQISREIGNPYLGRAMPTHGEIKP